MRLYYFGTFELVKFIFHFILYFPIGEELGYFIKPLTFAYWPWPSPLPLASPFASLALSLCSLIRIRIIRKNSGCLYSFCSLHS